MKMGPVLSPPFADRGRTPMRQETAIFMSKDGTHRPTGEFHVASNCAESEWQFGPQKPMCPMYFRD